MPGFWVSPHRSERISRGRECSARDVAALRAQSAGVESGRASSGEGADQSDEGASGRRGDESGESPRGGASQPERTGRRRCPAPSLPELATFPFPGIPQHAPRASAPATPWETGPGAVYAAQDLISSPVSGEQQNPGSAGRSGFPLPRGTPSAGVPGQVATGRRSEPAAAAVAPAWLPRGPIATPLPGQRDQPSARGRGRALASGSSGEQQSSACGRTGGSSWGRRSAPRPPPRAPAGGWLWRSRARRGSRGGRRRPRATRAA